MSPWSSHEHRVVDVKGKMNTCGSARDCSPLESNAMAMTRLSLAATVPFVVDALQIELVAPRSSKPSAPVIGSKRKLSLPQQEGILLGKAGSKPLLDER